MNFITLTNLIIKVSHVGYHKAPYCPLLFILYVNGITNTSNVLKFLELDTTVTYSHPDVVSKFDMINKELQEVYIVVLN